MVLTPFTLDFNLWKCTNQSHERSLWKEVIPVSAINCFFVVILCIICHFLSFYFSFHTYTHCLFKHVKLLINYFQTFQFWLLRSIVFYKHFTILLLYFLSRNFAIWQTVSKGSIFSIWARWLEIHMCVSCPNLFLIFSLWTEYLLVIDDEHHSNLEQG